MRRPLRSPALLVVGTALVVGVAVGILAGSGSGVSAFFVALYVLAGVADVASRGRDRTDEPSLQEIRRRQRLHETVRRRALVGVKRAPPPAAPPPPRAAAPPRARAVPGRIRGWARQKHVPWAGLFVLFVLGGSFVLWEADRRAPRSRPVRDTGWPPTAHRVVPDRPAPATPAPPLVAPGPRAEREDPSQDLPPSHVLRVWYRGTVRTEQGAALRGLPVVARTTRDTYLFAQTDDAGGFAYEAAPRSLCEILVPPVVVLDARAIPTCSALSSTAPIELVLPEATTLFLHRSFPPDLGGAIEVRVASTDGSHRGTGTWDPTDAVAVVVGARPLRPYDVLVRHGPSGRAALVEQVEPGAPIFVSLLPGVDLAGRVRLPADLAAGDVVANLVCRGLEFPVDLRPDGRFTAPVLPGGTHWTLRVVAPGVEGVREASWPVQAGSEVPIDVAFD